MKNIFKREWKTIIIGMVFMALVVACVWGIVNSMDNKVSSNIWSTATANDWARSCPYNYDK